MNVSRYQGKTSQVPKSYCTRCLRMHNKVTAVGEPGAAPAKHCVTLCVHCGHLMTFDELLQLRDLTPEEMLAVKRNKQWPEIQALQEKLRNAVAVFLRPVDEEQK